MDDSVRMTLSGWIFMGATWTLATVAVTFCIIKALTSKQSSGPKSGSSEQQQG